jgi:hypothetical protein
MEETLKRDQNHVTVLAGITDDSSQLVTMLRVDPTSKRLLVSATGSLTEIAIGDLISGGTAGSVLFVGADGTLAQDNANLFYDDTSNRLGIGTNTPASIVHIDSSTATVLTINTTDTSASAAVSLTENGVTTGILQMRGSTNAVLPSVIRVGANSAGWSSVLTSGNGTNNVFANSNGNTGMGTVTPTYRTTTSGSSGSTSIPALSNTIALAIENTNTTVNSYAPHYFVGADSAGTLEINAAILARMSSKTIGAQSADIILWTRNGGTGGEKARLTAAGLLGIGTTTPSTNLAVASTGANGIDILVDASTATQSGRFYMSNSTVGQSTTLLNVVGNLSFRTGATPGTNSGTERMILSGAGFLGVGAASPDNLLHVELSDAGTNAVVFPQRLTHITSGTATTGFGVGEQFELENASGTNVVVSTQEFAFTDATNASEDATYTLRLIRAGVLTEAMAVSSVGAMTANGVAVPTISSSDTLSNKTLTTPIVNGATLNGDIQIDGTPDIDDTWNGRSTNTFNAGATIAQFEAVYLDSSSTWQLTDADAAATAGSITVSLAGAAGTAANPLRVILPGTFVRNDAWNWTIGGTIYLDVTPGALTQTAPSGTDDVIRIVGYAVTADVIFWNPSNDYVTHI